VRRSGKSGRSGGSGRGRGRVLLEGFLQLMFDRGFGQGLSQLLFEPGFELGFLQRILERGFNQSFVQLLFDVSSSVRSDRSGCHVAWRAGLDGGRRGHGRQLPDGHGDWRSQPRGGGGSSGSGGGGGDNGGNGREHGGDEHLLYGYENGEWCGLEYFNVLFVLGWFSLGDLCLSGCKHK
jgi:hypothetical protein